MSNNLLKPLSSISSVKTGGGCDELKITIVEAVLGKEGKEGKFQNLYACVCIDNKKCFKTKIIKKSNHPVWGHGEMMRISSNATLTVTIYAEKGIGKDESIGSFSIDYKQSPANFDKDEIAQWFPICEGKVRVLYSVAPYSDCEDRMLGVTIYSARDICPPEMENSISPYCELKINNDIRRTSTLQDGKYPIWNEPFTFAIKEDVKTLKFSVYNCTDTENDEFLGCVKISLEEIPILYNPEECANKWYELDKTSMKKSTINICLFSMFKELKNQYDVNDNQFAANTLPELSTIPPLSQSKSDKGLSRENILLNLPSQKIMAKINEKKEKKRRKEKGLNSGTESGISDSDSISLRSTNSSNRNSVSSNRSSVASCRGLISVDPVSHPAQKNSLTSENSEIGDEKWILCAKIISASDLLQWPVSMQPRSQCEMQIDEFKAKTKSLGNLIEYGGQDHVHPVWNEILMLPIESMKSECRIKVLTNTSSHVTNKKTCHSIGTFSLEFKVIPKCVEPIDEDDDTIESKCIEVNIEPDEELSPEIKKKIAQEDVSQEERFPAKYNIELRSVKAGPKSVLKVRSKKTGTCKIKILACLIPQSAAGDMEGVEDEGDPNPNSEPITFPEMEKWLLIEEELPCSFTKLNRLLFSTDSVFRAKFQEQRRYTNVEMSEWAISEEEEFKGKMVRKGQYLMPPSAMIKALMAYETQWKEIDEEGGCVVNIVVKNPDAPMGTTFETHVQISISKLAERKSLLRVSADVHFVKSAGILKGQIEKGCRKGTELSYIEFLDLLRTEITGKKKKKVVEEVVNIVWWKTTYTVPVLLLLAMLSLTTLSICINIFLLLQ